MLAPQPCPTFGRYCPLPHPSGLVRRRSSNLAAIKVGSKIFVDQAVGIPTGLLDRNVVLDAGSGNRAVGRCTLDLGTGFGLCTFSDGQFTKLQARVDVTYVGGLNYRYDGIAAGSCSVCGDVRARRFLLHLSADRDPQPLGVTATKVVHPGEPGQAVGCQIHRHGWGDRPDERPQECAADAARSTLVG